MEAAFLPENATPLISAGRFRAGDPAPQRRVPHLRLSMKGMKVRPARYKAAAPLRTRVMKTNLPAETYYRGGWR